jgi:hypothetical protein
MDNLEEVECLRRRFRLHKACRSGFTISQQQKCYPVRLTGPIMVACQWYYCSSAYTLANQISAHLPNHLL